MGISSKGSISRRQFLKYSGIAAAGLSASGALSAFGADEQRPNILYIMTDEQFEGAMGCAGCADVKTPALDSLAAMGARFTKTYCTMPLCTPSWASMWTGRMPHECRVTENTKPIPEFNNPTELGILLSRAGYDCQYSGKWHLPGYIMGKGHGFATLSKDGDQIVEEACLKYLNQKHDKSFFLVASFHDPHDICGYAGHRSLSRLGNGPVPEAGPERWPALPANAGVPLREPPIVREYQWGARQFPTQGWDEAEWRRYRYAYYGMCEVVDTRIGKLLKALKDNGLEDNTVIIFSSDHGDGLGAHGWNQKWILYEEMSRVPFIVAFKGRTKAGLVDDTHLVSQGLDFYATVLDYAGIKQPDYCRGRSLRSLAEGAYVSDWRDQVVTETWLNYPTPAGRALRTKRYKYTCWSQGKMREMLVDLDEDPGEMFNLVGNKKFEPILNEHRKRLVDWCTETGDEFKYIKPA
jgi:arylsulfatase A-like enzyme